MQIIIQFISHAGSASYIFIIWKDLYNYLYYIIIIAKHNIFIFKAIAQWHIVLGGSNPSLKLYTYVKIDSQEASEALNLQD